MVDYDGGPDNVVYETQCGNSRFSVKSISWKMSSEKKWQFWLCYSHFATN